MEKKTGKELVALFEVATRTYDITNSYKLEDFDAIRKECKEAKKELLDYIQKLEERCSDEK